jgi:hypothetical protein
MPGLPRRLVLLALAAAVGVAGCAVRSGEVRPLAADPAVFATWDCERIDTEADAVQRRAADVAYTVDERAGNNIIAMGLGLMVFWPALLAMRPPGVEADELARLKGRHEALTAAAKARPCPPPSQALPAAQVAALPLTVGERLVYEERTGPRGPMAESALQLTAMRRGELEFRTVPPVAAGDARVLQDLAGNVLQAPPGQLQWPRLLRHDMVLGQVLGGEIAVADNPQRNARVRGQVVAVGPQSQAGRSFDVAVVELFGDARNGDESTRLDGVIVVDRHSGVLLRLDLRSAMAGFTLQRRLARFEPASR